MKHKFYILIIIVLVGVQNFETLQANDIDTVWMRWTKEEVNHIAISPDSRYIVINSSSNAYLFDLETGNEILKIGSVQQAVFTKDNNFIIGHWYKNVVLYDINLRQINNLFQPCPDNINFISFNSDSTKLIGSYANNEGYCIWDMISGQIIKEKLFNKSNDDISYSTGRVEFSKNNNQIYYSVSRIINPFKPPFTEYYDELKFMDSNDSLLLLKDNLFAIEVSSQKKYLVCWKKENNEFNKLSVFNTETYETVFEIPGSLSDIKDITFSLDDRYLAIAHENKNKLEIWDLELKNKVFEYFTVPAGYGIVACAISSNKNYIAYNSGKVLYLCNFFTINQIEENNIETTITYPNPADNIFNIEFNLIQNNITNINMVDLLGNNVKEIDNNFLIAGHYFYSVDITNLPPGFYTLRILSGNYIFFKKIVKK